MTMDAPIPGRREFLRQVASGAVLGAGAGLAGCSSPSVNNTELAAFDFLHGVASGDPLTDRVILWTRVTPRAPATQAPHMLHTLQWQMATDAVMQTLVAQGSTSTSAARDYTVKVDATGLLPGHVYYYQFAIDGVRSQIGRTRTLPRTDVRQVRLAVFSCSNYPAGFFNVYADAARQNDIDVALHIGDYIYEYESTGYACGHAEALGRLSEPRELLLQLDDYRRRYAQYRSDPDLQAVHAALPFITVWDDHEFADDTWRDGAVAHQVRQHGPFSLRKQAALTAYHEWLPIRTPDPASPEKIYRSFDFGSVLSLHMLDTRVVGRDQQLIMSSYYDAQRHFDAEKFRHDVTSPRRQMMGSEQLAWLEQRVEQSDARWQVLGMMQRHRKNLVVLAGDTHNAWASDLHDAAGRQVGVEFATASVSSPGMEGAYPQRDPDDVAAMMVDLIAPLYYAQTSKRGYMIITASHEQVRCDWRFVDTVMQREFVAATERSLRTLPGPGNRRIEECVRG